MRVQACLHCGYNLRGVCSPQRPRGECPECGTAFEFGQLRSLPKYVTRWAWWAQTYAILLTVAVLVVGSVLLVLSLYYHSGLMVAYSAYVAYPTGMLIVGCWVFTPLWVAHPLAKEMLRMPSSATPTLVSVMLAVVEYTVVVVLQVVACGMVVVVWALLAIPVLEALDR